MNRRTAVAWILAGIGAVVVGLKTLTGRRRQTCRYAGARDLFPHSTMRCRDAGWGSSVARAGAVTVTDGVCEVAVPAASDAAIIYYATKINKAVSQLWAININPRASGTIDSFCYVVNRATAPVCAPRATFETDARIRFSFAALSGVLGMQWSYWDKTHVPQTYSGVSNAWGTTAAHAYSPTQADDYYECVLEIDGPGARFRLLGRGKAARGSAYTFDQGYRWFAISEWVPWKELEATTDLWLVIGEPYTDTPITGTMRIASVRHSDGAVVHAWVNQQDTRESGWSIRHHYSFDGKMFVPQDRTTVAVGRGAAGQWDDHNAKDKTVLLSGGTYYMYYSAKGPTGIQLGLATATSPDGPWTKNTANPIISRVAGGDESEVFAPYLVEDVSAPSAERFKLFYGAIGADSRGRIFMRTAAAAIGPWSPSTIFLSPGSGSDPDVNSVNAPVVIWDATNSRWEVWYGGNRDGTPATWSACRAYGTNLKSLTKDTDNNPYRTRANARQALTANLSGRIVTVGCTSGFTADALVIFDQDASIDNYSISRIRRVLSATQLELYHSIVGFTTANHAEVRQLDDSAGGVGAIRQVGSEWWFYPTIFGLFADHPTIRAYCEMTGLMTSPTLTTKPKTWVWESIPPVGTGEWNGRRSAENIALVNTPITRVLNSTASPPPAEI